MDDPAKRDAAGRFGDGNRANPSGRPKIVREYQEWLMENAFPKAKQLLMEMLENGTERERIFAVKEVHDRILGKAPQAITGQDGAPLLNGAEGLFEVLRKLADRG